MGQLPIIVEFEEQTSPDLYARIVKVFMDIVHNLLKNEKYRGCYTYNKSSA